MINHFIGKFFGRAVGCPCHEDLFDFALDGLDSKGKESVRKHLGDCPHCRDQVKDYAWVSEGIALTAPQIEPPVDICDKVKARIRAEGGPAPVISLGRDPLAGWPRFWMRLGPVFAFGSLAMTALAFIAVFNRPLPQGAEMQAASKLLDSPSVRLVSLSGDGGSQGSLFMAAGQDQVMLKVHGLKACSQGRSYGLWACPKGGKPSLLGSFQAVDGRCSYMLSLEKPLENSAQSLDFEVTQQDAEKNSSLEKGPTQMRGRYNL